MKLLLHIGTEKTGSSYLQSILSNNHKQLLNKGFLFPSSLKWDKEMLKGNISQGNGEVLQKSLFRAETRKVSLILAKTLQEALRTGVSNVLISNELFYKSFNSRLSFENFEQICLDVGFEEVHLFMFIREPISQALSLYKHRAKTGRNVNFEDWLNNGYSLPNDLEMLLSQNIKNLTIRRYEPNSDIILKRFVFDWLGIDTKCLKETFTHVNRSLSLSELRLIAVVKSRWPYLVDLIYQRLLELPKSEKTDESLIENHFKSLISEKILAYASVWELVNEHLLNGENLTIQEFTINHKKNIEWTFSEIQLDLIVHTIVNGSNIPKRLKFYLKKALRPIARLKWAVINKLNINY